MRYRDRDEILSATNVFTHACILEATVATNCPQGGDAGHGGRTEVVLKDAGDFAIEGNADEIRFAVLGDAEAEVLAQALEWAASELRKLMAMPPR